MVTQNSLNNTIGSNGQLYNATTSKPPLFSNNSSLLIATLTLTSSQVKNLHSTPITLISAAGSGKTILVYFATGNLEYGGSNAFVATGSQIDLNYNNASGDTSTQAVMNNNAITATTGYSCFSTYNAGLGDFSSKYENQNIVIYQTNSTEISGNAANDNAIKITALYSIFSI